MPAYLILILILILIDLIFLVFYLIDCNPRSSCVSWNIFN